MTTCHIHHLESRCRQRGYTLEEVRDCIVSQDGYRITVDVDHPAYPRTPKLGVSTGPGTEMKALLAKIGIVASPTCSCNKRAKIMDENGCDWCEQNVDEIDGWLAEEAGKRKLPYLSLVGKALIHLAIRRARKKDNSQ